MNVVAIYLRISQDREKTGEGVERQKIECLQRVYEGEQVKFYEDNDKSASKNVRRPEYERLKLDVERGKVQRVLAWSLDRLTRKPRDIEDWIDLSQKTGVKLTTVRENFDVTNEAGRANLRFVATMAAMEVERKSERQKAANRQRIAKGKPISGRRPYGYEEDQLSLRPEESQWIAFATEAVIAGKSLVSIARHLNSEGAQTSTGKSWSTTQLRTMLLRERNCGRLLSLGQIYDASQIEAAVTVEDFELCQSILTNPDRNTRRGPAAEKSWLTGILKCGVCGSPMYVKNITGKHYKSRNYICDSKPSGRGKSGDTHPSISCRIAEAGLVEFLADLYTEGLRRVPAAPEDNESRLRSVLQLQRENWQQRSDLSEDLTIAGVDKKVLREKIETLKSDFDSLESERLALVAGGASRDLLLDLFDFTKIKTSIPRDFLAEIDKAVDQFRRAFDALPSDQKRTIVSGTVRVTVELGWGSRRMRFELLEPERWWLGFDEPTEGAY